MKKKINIPSYANKILTHLEASGFEAFVVGGCVRDSLRGVTPLDWDICTSALPEKVSFIFKDILPVIPTGIKHGTVTILSEGIPVEVTTYRTDGKYNDNRRPENVSFVTSVTHDLARRDFTMNAIAYNHKRGIIDLFGGISDIESKTVRCVGNPEKRFEEDALRILRALRFSAVCEFGMEEQTRQAIFSCKDLLKNISSERIFAEIKKLLLATNPSNILIKFQKIFEVCIPYETPELYLKMTDILPKILPLRVAALLGGTDADDVRKILNSLRADKALTHSVCCIADNVGLPCPTTRAELKRMMHKLGIENTRNILTFKYAKETAAGGNPSTITSVLNLIDEILNSNECFSLNSLSINGLDLISLGINSGNEIGYILNSLLFLVIDGKIQNVKSVLLDKANEIYKNLN